jgi:hypothetical protein
LLLRYDLARGMRPSVARQTLTSARQAFIGREAIIKRVHGKLPSGTRQLQSVRGKLSSGVRQSSLGRSTSSSELEVGFHRVRSTRAGARQVSIERGTKLPSGARQASIDRAAKFKWARGKLSPVMRYNPSQCMDPSVSRQTAIDCDVSFRRSLS